MHVYYIMIKIRQKFWVVYVHYRFIPEQCECASLIWQFGILSSNQYPLLPNSVHRVINNFLTLIMF